MCNSNLVMCPRCDKECHYWFLNESCTAAKLTYLVDNAGTVFFAIFMSLWGMFLLNYNSLYMFVLIFEEKYKFFHEYNQHMLKN